MVVLTTEDSVSTLDGLLVGASKKLTKASSTAEGVQEAFDADDTTKSWNERSLQGPAFGLDAEDLLAPDAWRMGIVVGSVVDGVHGLGDRYLASGPYGRKVA